MALKLLGNVNRGLAFIVSAPAGTGKTTLVERLTSEFPCVIASVSCTTRQPRPGELEGKHYQFISEEQFQEKVLRGEFLEYVHLYGYYYGSSRQWIEQHLKEGKHVVLVIDTQGAIAIRKIFPVITIFVRPPSVRELERRLRRRGTESQKKIVERLKSAQRELEAVKDYDYEIVNDDLEIAYQVLRSIFIAEEHRILSDHY